jgi:hypothetical protein
MFWSTETAELVALVVEAGVVVEAAEAFAIAVILGDMMEIS